MTATAGRGAALTVTANQAGTAGNGIAVTLSSSTSEPGLFSSPSYSGNSGTLSGGVDPAATPGAIYNYTIPSPPTPSTGYAGNGNLLSFTDMVNGQWTAGYDTLNRLTSATLAGQPTYAWTYDAFGNRTSSSPNGGATNYPLPINRSSAWQYDFSGRVIDDGSNQYTYDGEGRLCVAYNKTLVSYTGYAYDGLGNRVARGAVSGPGCNNSLTASQTFVVGINGELLDTLSASGAVSSNVQASGQLLATYQYGAGNWSYALNDWLGTKRVVANADGTIQETCLGLPFGDGLNCTGTDASTLHFTGKERDTESGNDYFGARYYGSSMGRFTSPDPTFLNIRRVFNPQRWNMYSYALNNPLTNIDPDGNEVIPVVYPNYMANSRGNIPAPTGHAGVVLVEQDGKTHYFEYGRYPNGNQSTSDGAMREAATPDVQRDASGNITPDSMNNLLQSLSGSSGRSGSVEALVIPTTSGEDSAILAYLKAREAQNSDPKREKYDLWGAHNCGTLACEAMRSAGMNAIKTTFSTPYANFMNLWTLYGGEGWRYEPKEHVTVRIRYDDVQ